MAPKLPSPPGATLATQESHRLVRERMFGGASLTHVLESIRDSHSTGTLLIDISQGAIGSIRFREEHKVTFDENNS